MSGSLAPSGSGTKNSPPNLGADGRKQSMMSSTSEGSIKLYGGSRSGSMSSVDSRKLGSGIGGSPKSPANMSRRQSSYSLFEREDSIMLGRKDSFARRETETNSQQQQQQRARSLAGDDERHAEHHEGDEPEPAGQWIVSVQKCIACFPWIVRTTDTRGERAKKVAAFSLLVSVGLGGLLMGIGLATEMGSNSGNGALIVATVASLLIFVYTLVNWIVINAVYAPAEEGEPSPAVPPALMDIAAFVIVLCSCAVGVCWGGAAVPCLLVAVNANAITALVESSDVVFRPFILRPTLLIVCCFLAVRSAEESFLLSPELSAVPSFAFHAGGAAVLTQGGGTAGILGAVAATWNAAVLVMFLFVAKAVSDRERASGSGSGSDSKSRSAVQRLSQTTRLACRAVSALLHNEPEAAKVLLGNRQLLRQSSTTTAADMMKRAGSGERDAADDSDADMKASISTHVSEVSGKGSGKGGARGEGSTSAPTAVTTGNENDNDVHETNIGSGEDDEEEVEPSELEKQEKHRREEVEKARLAALRRLDPAVLFPKANMRSPLMQALVVLAERYDTYLNFVPEWVKNPQMQEEEEEDENVSMGSGSETWSNSDWSKSSNNNIFGRKPSQSGGAFPPSRSPHGGGAGGKGGADTSATADKKGSSGGGGMFGEFDMEDQGPDDDITSARGGQGGDKDGAAANLQSLAHGGGHGDSGFAGKITIAVLNVDLNFTKFVQEMRMRELNSSPEGSGGDKSTASTDDSLPHAVPPPPPSAAEATSITGGGKTSSSEGLGLRREGSSGNLKREASGLAAIAHAFSGLSKDPTPSEIERKVVERVLEQVQMTGGTLHSVVAGRITISWNTMSRVAAPEHKAARCLLLSHKLGKSGEFPGLRVSGAAMTGYGRATVAKHGHLHTPVITARWWRELETLATLARLDQTVIIDLSIKHAIFFEFGVRGHGCVQKTQEAAMAAPTEMNRQSSAPVSSVAVAASPQVSRLAPAPRKGNKSPPSDPSLLSRQSSGGSGSGIYEKEGQEDDGKSMMPIFSIVHRRTGPSDEWLYVGSSESGGADSSNISCSAIDHAAAGNFASAKKEYEGALGIAGEDLVALEEKKAMNSPNHPGGGHKYPTNGPHHKKTQQEREMDTLDEQIENLKYSTQIFSRLVKRLEERATTDSFPYKISVQ